MDGWTLERRNGRMNMQTDERTDGRTNLWKDKWRHERTKEMDGRTRKRTFFASFASLAKGKNLLLSRRGEFAREEKPFVEKFEPFILNL